MMYKYTFNQRDMNQSFTKGFWIGLTTGAVVIFSLCLILGLYY